jgi:hypothetical protein
MRVAAIKRAAATMLVGHADSEIPTLGRTRNARKQNA